MVVDALQTGEGAAAIDDGHVAEANDAIARLLHEDRPHEAPADRAPRVLVQVALQIDRQARLMS